jgi:ParB/RepB/Spo0J family partition protein
VQPRIEISKLSPPKLDGRYPSKKQQRLNKSVAKYGVLVPLIINRNNGVIDGNHRLFAAIANGLTTIPYVFIENEVRSEKAVGLVLNMRRVNLSHFHRCLGFQETLEANPEMTQKELAEELGEDASTVQKSLSLYKCIPSVFQAAKDGLINQSQWNSISKCENPNDQEQALQQALAGSTRDQIKAARRKPSTNTVKIDRAKLALPGGKVVTVAGSGLTLEDVHSALAAAIEGVKKAIKERVCVKTACRWFADQATQANQ